MTGLAPEIAAKLSAEHNEIREGIAEITMAWSSIETAMAILLRDILADPSGDVAFAIYFSPASAEVRFNIVDAAFCSSMGHISVDPDLFRVVISSWNTLLGRLNSKKQLRNAVAHGTISTFHRYNKNHIRLTPPLFDFRRITPAIRRRQIPGLSANDIKTGAREMWAVVELINLFSELARAWHAKDKTAVEKMASEVVARLTKRPP